MGQRTRLGRTAEGIAIPNQAKSAHADRLQIAVPRGNLEGGAEDLRAYELGHGGGG